MGTVQDRRADAGISQLFKATFEDTEAAALASVQAMNVDVTRTGPIIGGSEILFVKPTSGWSWGEVGRVTILRTDIGDVLVSVTSAKRLRGQVSGTSEKKFAAQVFAGMAERLAGPNAQVIEQGREKTGS